MSPQEPSNVRLLRHLLRDYYSKVKLDLPPDFMLREFAFQTFTGRNYVRHLSFQSLASLREFLSRETPRNAYYSAAIYRDPAATSMEDKGLIGAELMFDIDVDHIEGCKATSIQADNISLHIINEECIELGKNHELRLLDTLKNDFGFSNDEILIYYTGNRGFHTVVRPKDDDWLKLPSPQRRELVDYIRGIGLNLRVLLPLRKLSKIRPEIAISGGWRRKIVNAGLSYEELIEGGEDLIIKRSYVEIDEQVTPDLSRLIRIPNSVNGKSGLPSKVLRDESELIDFKYGAYLSPFQGKALVKANITLPKLRIFNDEISLVKNQTLLISAPDAVLLALNDVVELLKLL